MFSRHWLQRILPFWFLVLFCGSFMPSGAKRVIGTHADAPRSIRVAPTRLHRVWHFGSFGATALLVSLATARRNRRLVHCAGVFLFGLAIELTQSRVIHMPVEWYDVRDDAIGVLVFSLAAQNQRLRRLLVREASSGEV